MANLIEIPNNTQPLIQHYIDQMGADQDKRAQLDLQQQQINNTNTYQTGMLDARNKEVGMQQTTSDMARYEQMYNAAVAPFLNSGRPEDFATAKQNIQQIIQQDPNAAKYFAAIAMRAQSGPLPADQANASANQFKNTQLTAANTTPDANAANYATKVTTNSFMPTEGFKVAEAKQLAAQDSTGGATPNLAQRNPAPSGNAVADTLSRDVGAMPTGAQNQQAQTSLTQTGMQIAADAPYKAAMTREASAKAAISEGQAKMMSGDPSAVNSFAIGVAINPRSFDSLTTDEKRMAVHGLGNRAPAKLNQQEENAFDAAQNTKDGVKRAIGILQKWQQRGVQITGPMIGRYNEMTNTWGDSILPSNLPPDQAGELQGDIAALQQNFGINKLNELHAVIGGRVPQQMVQIISAPNMAQNPNMIAGALGAMYQIADGRVKQLQTRIWNGQPPQLSGATLAKYQEIAGTQNATNPGAAVISPGEAWAQKYKQRPQPNVALPSNPGAIQ